MLVDELYYGRHRVQRVYQNGKIIWYAGDMLPMTMFAELASIGDVYGGVMTLPIVQLFNGIEVQIIPASIVYGGLTIAPVPLGNAVAGQYVRSWSSQNGTALRAVTADKFGLDFVRHFQSADVCIARVALGDRGAGHVVDVQGSSIGVAVPARLGIRLVGHNVFDSGSATSIAATAELGTLLGDHKVFDSGYATSIAATAELGTLLGDHKVFDSGYATSIAATAELGTILGDHKVFDSGYATSIAATARLGTILRDYHVFDSGYATSIAATARLGDMDVNHALSPDEASVGTVADAALGWHDANLRIISINKSILSVPDITNINGKIIEFVHFNTKGRGTEAPAVSFVGVKTNNMPVTGKSDIVALRSTLASSRNNINLSAPLCGGITKNIRIVSASVRDDSCLNFAGVACLSDFQLPVTEDGNLHIRQAYDIAHVGYRLMLSEQDIKELPDKVISKPMLTTVGLNPVSNVNLSDWKLSLAFGDHLYIRQTERGIRNGTNLYVSDWDYPIMANGNLYIRQSDSDIALS